jgi:hypothetical protein
VTDDLHATFREAVAASALLDPMPTFERLSASTAVPVDQLVHHALVRWVSAGSEAILQIGPPVVRELVDARRREDWQAVAGMIDWLETGL